MTVGIMCLAEPGDAAATAGSQVMLYAEVLLALCGVLVLAYVVLRVGLPRVFGLQLSKNGPIQIVGRYPLEPKKTLYLVKMGSQVLLIATSDSQVQFLTGVDPENAAAILAAVQVAEPQRKVFRQFMSSFRQS